jgi:predicted RNase H-like HicB family nuclease
VISDYLREAMARARVERMEDGRYFGRIEGLQGPWADGDTPQECLEALRAVLEEWLVLALRDDDDLPVLGNVSLNFGGRRWSAQPLAANLSAS